MLALLLATERTGDLAALAAGRPSVMLPILDRSLLLHAIDGLVGAGVRRLLVAVADEDRGTVRMELATFAAGGVSLELVRGVRGESPFDAAARLAPDARELLVARAEVMRSPFLGRFLATAGAQPGVSLAATASGTDAGLWRLCPDSAPPKAVDHPDAHAAAIDTPTALHRATLDALSGRFGSLPERAERQSRHAHGITWTGRQGRIGRDVRMEGRVVLGAGASIGPRAVLRDAIVFPGTWVGADVQLHDAIVSGDTLARVDTGVVVQVTDAALLGHRPVARAAEPLMTVVRFATVIVRSSVGTVRGVRGALGRLVRRRGDPARRNAPLP